MHFIFTYSKSKFYIILVFIQLRRCIIKNKLSLNKFEYGCIWDTIELKGPLTVNEMMKHFKDKYKVTPSLITWGDKAIYNQYANKDVMKERLNQKIEEIYCIVNNKKNAKDLNYLLIDVGGSTISDSTDISMPKIKYMF